MLTGMLSAGLIVCIPHYCIVQNRFVTRDTLLIYPTTTLESSYFYGVDSKQKMSGVDQISFMFQDITMNFHMCEEVLAIIGLFFVGKIAFSLTWNVLQGIRTHVLARFRLVDFTKYGKWAVVTGGTDGIGKAYVQDLARRGMNIIIISRNKDKLEATAQEIEKDFKVQTFTIQADFGAGRKIYDRITEQLKDKEIGVLINNVGVCYEYPEYFNDIPEQKIWDLININIASVTMMTYLVLPQMVQRKKGVIVNISSISSIYPVPLLAAYSASKMFVDSFSRALWYEYKDQGIIMQSLIPSYIATKMMKYSSFLNRPSFIVPDSKRFVNSAIQTIGVTNHTTGFWPHGLLYCMCDMIPVSVFYRVIWLWQRVTDDHKSVDKKK